MLIKLPAAGENEFLLMAILFFSHLKLHVEAMLRQKRFGFEKDDSFVSLVTNLNNKNNDCKQ